MSINDTSNLKQHIENLDGQLSIALTDISTMECLNVDNDTRNEIESIKSSIYEGYEKLNQLFWNLNNK